MDLRPLGTTGLRVSPLGLGTVKFGRTTGVRYPTTFELPSDERCREVLSLAHDLGINLIDTAPAYGVSEERLGGLLPGRRERWVLSTKCGEEFDGRVSRFDFSAAATRESVERSLRRLRTDVLDIVLIHSNGADMEILRRGETVETLRDLQTEGKVRAIGMSVKTLEGAREAAIHLDVVMLTYNLAERDMVDAIRSFPDIGVLVKKPLASGHLAAAGGAPTPTLREAYSLIFREKNVAAAIVGTISAAHLRENVDAVRAVVG